MPKIQEKEILLNAQKIENANFIKTMINRKTIMVTNS